MKEHQGIKLNKGGDNFSCCHPSRIQVQALISHRGKSGLGFLGKFCLKTTVSVMRRFWLKLAIYCSDLLTGEAIALII
nr:hypothetical protein [Thalassomonas actiniarum]